MAYVRISLMQPLTGRESEVEKLNLELVQFYRTREGCLGSHVLRATDRSGEIGRLSFWMSEFMADAAATTDHSMSLRSRLHLIIAPGHEQRSFYSE